MDYGYFAQMKPTTRLFVRPWTLKQGSCIVIALVFAFVESGVARDGWGLLPSPYGLWFGKAFDDVWRFSRSFS
ncbi:MAG: hypothetical protein U5K84_10075 [Alkalibacterium sp.]|nr:hypothetical protein [Alkalibacterium sp.]